MMNHLFSKILILEIFYNKKLIINMRDAYVIISLLFLCKSVKATSNGDNINLALPRYSRLI